MKRKKKVLLISIMLLTLIITISTIFIVNKNSSNNEIVMKDNNNNNKTINNFLTLMLEQSDGSYAESTSNTWPGEGYIFNKELSSCQNGGELDYDSENNKVILYSNKSDGCYVYFDIYNKPVINSINLTEVTNNSITISVSATEGTNPISNYYYVINDGNPVSTTSNTYTFSGLSAGETYTIKVYIVDKEGYSSDTSSLNVETESIVYLADYIKNTVYQGDGINNLYYHDGQGSYTNANQEIGDNSYRYSGANPNNYVCFGSDAATCPEDNLYRIIGVFGSEVKLIKSTYGTSSQLGTGGAYVSSYNYYWNNSNGSRSTNTWSEANLNTVNLNTNFLNNIGSTWSNLIATHSWKVGGMTRANGGTSNAKTAYNYEVGSSSSSTTYSAKIGLMYVSDYYYGATNTYWTYPGYSGSAAGSNYDYRAAASNNWMCLGVTEWTISRVSDDSHYAFYVYYSGLVNGYTVNYGSSAVRPVFYLTSSTTYVSGSGTESDPIRLS